MNFLDLMTHIDEKISSDFLSLKLKETETHKEDQDHLDQSDDDDEYEYCDDGDDGDEIQQNNIVKPKEPIKIKTTIMDDKLVGLIVLKTFNVPLHVKNLLIKQFKTCLMEGYTVDLYQDNITQWIVQLKPDLIDHDSMLYRDLKQYGIDYITLEINFPITYPNSPPYCRVIQPIFELRTGHVLIDGAICNELLTQSKWNIVIQPDQLLKLIASSFVEGEGRIDVHRFKEIYHYDASRTAFKRMLSTHGWS